jgi:hypothetical protein
MGAASSVDRRSRTPAVGDPAPRARQGSTAAASMGAALCRSQFGARNRGKVGRFDEVRVDAGCVAPPLAAAAGR